MPPPMTRQSYSDAAVAWRGCGNVVDLNDVRGDGANADVGCIIMDRPLINSNNRRRDGSSIN